MTAVALAMVIGLSYTGYPVHAQEETEINPPATVEDVAEQEQDDSPDETETATEKNEITENENLTENEELSANANAVTAGTEALGKITTYAENNAGSFHVTGGTAETDWTYDSDENTLTFNNSGTYTITGDGQETAERIIVSDNFNGTITIENINIRSNCAFEVKNTATLTLMLVGNNTLTSTGSAGLLFENATTGKLIIDSDTAGSLTTTTSSWISAGIGGGNRTSGNNITINGGTITTTGDNGAGIGGGDRASGNNITINGGTVTATSSEGAGIGDGCGAYFYGSGSNITITGGSVKASSISPTPTDGKGDNVYLARIDNLSGVHSVTVDNATYTRAGDHPDDGAFYLYLTGEAHTIEVNGKSTSIQWDSDNSRFVTSDSEFINLPLEISSTAINADWFYDINDRTFNLLSGNDYTITGGGTEVNCRIIVADNFSGTVTLENVNINGTGEIVSLGENTHLTLKFNGENNLSTTGQVAAISTTYESSSLTFDSDTNGILNVTASSGVAIGGWSNTYNITFNGGTINASGYTYQQSDIGVPLYGNGTTAKNIVVNGGTVNCLKSALGNSYGGNKFYSCGCQITINGGTVTAPCIGGSTNTENTKVTINGGSVKGKIQTYGTLTDSNNNVYLVKLDNLSGVNEVTVDGTTTYTRNSDHPDDGAFYLYLTGENHIITTTKGDYTAQWISDSNSFKVSAPKPTVTIQSKTATSITVQPLADIDTYGEAEYRINNTDWQSSNVFTELAANTEYTVHARYKGNESYLQSEAESTTVTTMKDGNTLINAEKPTGLTGVYGQKLSDVSLADTDWTWSNGETALAVNTISYSARFNTTDYENEYDFSNVSGYNSSSHYVEIDLTVTVSQATNEWTSELSIADWTYGQAASTPTATARYGNVVFAYSDSENGTFATDVPTESGTWYVKATVAGTADYTGLEAVTNFEIKKADSTISFNEGVSIGKEYNGEAVEITADDVTKTGSTNDVDFSWQQKEDDDWTDLTFAPVNAGSYRVIASVKEDRNFKGASATIEFAISQTTNEWTSELSIEDWTYGQKASAPTATAQYGDVTFTYSDKKDGTYTDTVPTDAGTWYVKASVAGNENYTGLETVKNLT